jgi:hypothetical protein
MSKYTVCCYEQGNEEGTMRIAHTFEATNEKQARAKATLLFMEAFPEADDASFEMRIYAVVEGVPFPTEEWDETFLFEHDWNKELGHPVAKTQVKPVEFYKLSEAMRVAVLVKFGTSEINNDDLPKAIELLQDDASTFDGHITEAITKMPAIASMHPERVIEAINYVIEKCPPSKKWPDIKAVLAGWLKQHEEERKEGAVDAISTGAAEPVTTVVPRPYKHTFDTLDIEIASALWAGDVDPNGPLPSVTRWANGIIKDDREDFKRWSIQLRTQPNILKYDRPTIFGVVRNVPATDTYHFPESHKQYITGYLKAHGKMENEDDETEQNTAASTGPLESESPETSTVASQYSDDESATGTVETAPPVERTGPFYWRSANADKIGRANKLHSLEALIKENGYIEISQQEHQARKAGTYVDPEQERLAREGLRAAFEERTEQLETALGENVSPEPEVKKIADGVSSIDNLMEEQQKSESSAPSNEVEKTEDEPQPDNFQQRAEHVEKDFAGQPKDVQDNLGLWKKVHKTDEKFTKAFANNGGGTSINGTWMVMQATKHLGPQGINWKVEILEERFENGAPLFRNVKDGNGNPVQEIIPDGRGGYLTEVNHTIKVRFWYQWHGQEGEIFAYGCTPYITRTKNGVMSDGEAPKKSLTDATKKALSQLGFSADVFLGLFDDPQYRKDNADEFALTNAGEKAGDVTRLRNELDEKLTRVANTIEHAVIPNEAKKVFDTLAREVEVHRKAAEDKGDSEHVKYLSGRLRRLSQIKDQRIKILTENQEQSA